MHDNIEGPKHCVRKNIIQKISSKNDLDYDTSMIWFLIFIWNTLLCGFLETALEVNYFY